MTALTLTMPRLGETMEEGTIVGWLVEPGRGFRRGDPILELETDKTVVEYPALGDGTLGELLAGPGDRVPVGAPIARATVANAADWTDIADTPLPETQPVTLLAMPRLGETMEEGIVTRWLVAEGSAYARGESLLEIETDKTVAEVPALSEGKLVRILAAEGTRVTVGSPIAEIQGAATSAPDTMPAAPTAPAEVAPAPVAVSPATDRPRATPLARRLARQRGIALESLSGTGRRGRIERGDVERAYLALSAKATTTNGLRTVRIASEIQGDGGRMHLLIHGFSGDRTAWATTAAALRRAGHRVAILDLPGHGETEAEASDLASLTDPVASFAETLPGPLVLVGHSLGAAVATRLAARLDDRVAALVLLTPVGCGPRIGAEFLQGMARATSEGEVSHLLRLLGPKGGAVSDEALSRMAAEQARGRLRALADAVATPDGQQRIDLIRALAALPSDLPVRALFGTDDRIVSATDALNLPPRVGAHFLAAGHMPQWDAPREVIDLILSADLRKTLEDGEETRRNPVPNKQAAAREVRHEPA